MTNARASIISIMNIGIRRGMIIGIRRGMIIGIRRRGGGPPR
jgi:hypothetical protein